MDQLILAAHDVVEAWENHTLDLEATIRRLAEALRARTAEATTETPDLRPATVG